MPTALMLSLLPTLALALNPDGTPKIHTVFCAECSNNFDYKSIGVYWSHNVSGMPGGVTRLLACSKEQLARDASGLHLGPTFVHENHGRIPYSQTPNELGLPAGAKLPHGARSSDSSPSYNKPGSIMHWVNEAEEARDVDYVLYIDADMLLRKPMDPVALGVRPGVVVSEHVGYLDTGLRNGLASEFLPDAEGVEYARGDLDRGPRRAGDVSGRKHSAGGWYHFFHMSDIRKIAHRWLHYCRMMRLNPQKYWRMIGPDGAPGGVDHDIVTGDSFVSHGQAPWISEMFGYVFAAAEARLTHVLTDGIVVYPDDIGAGRATEPYIIHYGLHCKVGAFAFTKYSHGGFDAVGCTGKVFGDPPQPKHLGGCAPRRCSRSTTRCATTTRSRTTTAAAPTRCPTRAPRGSALSRRARARTRRTAAPSGRRWVSARRIRASCRAAARARAAAATSRRRRSRFPHGRAASPLGGARAAAAARVGRADGAQLGRVQPGARRRRRPRGRHPLDGRRRAGGVGDGRDACAVAAQRLRSQSVQGGGGRRGRRREGRRASEEAQAPQAEHDGDAGDDGGGGGGGARRGARGCESRAAAGAKGASGAATADEGARGGGGDAVAGGGAPGGGAAGGGSRRRGWRRGRQRSYRR